MDHTPLVRIEVCIWTSPVSEPEAIFLLLNNCFLFDGKQIFGNAKILNSKTKRPLEIAGIPMADIFVKNETATASGTLKHRFVWALTMWAVVEGKITSTSTVYDSTSGNTGASEAYMCRLIGVPYVAVVAKELEEEKVRQITQFGGQIMKPLSARGEILGKWAIDHISELTKVDVETRNYWAERMAAERGGCFINQFGNANAAEDDHESGNYPLESTNVFHEIASQLKSRGFGLPHYFVHSAGTGGTISSVGKYITRYALPTRVLLADSQHSLYYDYVVYQKYGNLSAGDEGRPGWAPPGIAGIGYGYNTAPIVFRRSTSLLRTVIDEVVRMPDTATVAAMRSLRGVLDIDAGPSTALNFLVALFKAHAHSEGSEATSEKDRFSVVLIMGDPGRFYQSTYLNDTWVDSKMARYGGMEAIRCWQAKIDEAIRSGRNFAENTCDISITSS
ncbi:hypothetical protein PRIPAC_95245 [Pristionchus pacificus]|uniref:PALP domain-containing protein n=1 Tax=Pristionchus pacificus TaxID=54126 RepID=A0A2A6D2G7_PRIPA|nr:hypothetical protein PRIPAC_95245 [Pristionchus pacificus]|eukprot:PDM84483.1 hypothetical protein PRIPAC_33506 [Pristionchus pacificus]